MKQAITLSFLICAILQFANAQLLDTYDISTSPNGIITMPTGLPSAYSSFVKYTKIQAPNGQAIHFIAQNAITEAQIVRARNILQFYLTNVPDSQYGADKSAIINQMATNEAILMLLNGSDGDTNPPNVNAQPLYQNEMAVEGHTWYITNDYDNHRDAAYEEILHMMHDMGIGVDGPNTFPGALPVYQTAIRAAQDNADNNNFSIWPIEAATNPNWYNELANENSLSQEYLAAVVDVYYGLWGAWSESTSLGMWGLYISKTRAEIETEDPMGWDLMPKYFSPFININMDIDPSFNGTFTMAFDAEQLYTHKSQYLQHCTLTGTNSSNLKGNDEYNRLNGNAANNELEGGKGNDRLDGKTGIDVAKFTGNQNEYTVTTQNTMTIITDNTNDRDGVDTLLNIETIRYTDGDVNVMTSVHNISADKVFNIFPNPADSFLIVEWHPSNPIQSGGIKLYDHLGRVVEESTFETAIENVRIDVHHLPLGNYTIQIIGNNESSSRKLVIQ